MKYKFDIEPCLLRRISCGLICREGIGLLEIVHGSKITHLLFVSKYDGGYIWLYITHSSIKSESPWKRKARCPALRAKYSP